VLFIASYFCLQQSKQTAFFEAFFVCFFPDENETKKNGSILCLKMIQLKLEMLLVCN